MAQKIGRFEILRELGRGAQSVVYLCNDPHLQREVAIKTLHFSDSDPMQNASLLAEARTVSNLRHSNIVPIFEAGEADGDPYLVFEYVEGGNLAQLINNKPMPPVQVAEMLVAILGALAEAHTQGIIHRDLKPSNILIDSKGVPRVMDFGIAVRVSQEGQLKQEEGLSGTPAYMAPEYIENRTSNASTDIFAMGLIMLEMMSGHRVVKSDSIHTMFAQILTKPVQIPTNVKIDERLGSIALKACAQDPQLRFESAQQMQQAIQKYLSPEPTEDASAGEGKNKGTLDFLLRRMRHKSDFPVLSDSVSAINKLTHSDKESINKLSNTVLKDYALTNKILRIVNSAFYRQSGGGSISTVSRAVIVLGFDAIRNIALTVLMFEHLQNKENATQLKEGFLRANLSGLLARDLSQKLAPRESEEAFICAMFHGLGRLLAQFYFPEEVDEIRKVMQQRGCNDDAAVLQVLGISFNELGMGVAASWGFPTAIVNSMRRLSDGLIKKPVTKEETLHVISGFSNELCDAIANSPAEDRHKAMKQVSARFAACIQLSDEQLQKTLTKAVDDLSVVAQTLRVNLKQSPFARNARAWSGQSEKSATNQTGGRTDTGLGDLANTILTNDAGGHGQRPFGSASDDMTNPGASGGTGNTGSTRNPGDDEEAQALCEDVQATLAAGIQDISNSLVENFSLNDVLRITLETMYRAMGFKRVLLCLRNPKTNQMVGRFGFGPDTNEVAKTFNFPLSNGSDVFSVVASKGVDIIITDINDPTIAARIPAWYRQRVPAETFVLFPLMLKGIPVALIYCDKDKAGEIVIPPKELSLLKTLRNQALLAIKQAT